jgi:hypothetical protein
MIQTLSSDAFAGQLSAPTAVGVGPIFRGKIDLGEEKSARCYIKPLPDHVELSNGRILENRELLNEALGYVIAKAAGYTVAEKAGIIMLNLEQIPEATRNLLIQKTPKSKPQKDYLSWFSEDMQQPNLLKRVDKTAPPQLRNRQLAHLARKLVEHPETAAIVSFDEWIENCDRNLGNLLERPDGRLSLIDHGWMFRVPIWSPHSLKSSPYKLCNTIKELVNNHTSQWSERSPVKSARLMAYNNLAQTWRTKGSAAAQAVLDDFLDSFEKDSVMSFLSDRLDPPNYRQVVGLLL